MSETAHSVTIKSVEKGRPWWDFHCHHAPDDPKWDGVDEDGTVLAGQGCWALSWWEGVGEELLLTSDETTDVLASFQVRTVSSYDEVEFVLERPATPFTVETYQVDSPIGFEKPDSTEHYWRARHNSNGEIIAQGEGYSDKRDRDHIIDVLFPGVTVNEVEG